MADHVRLPRTDPNEGACASFKHLNNERNSLPVRHILLQENNRRGTGNGTLYVTKTQRRSVYNQPYAYQCRGVLWKLEKKKIGLTRVLILGLKAKPRDLVH